jgi:hypothetical protein
MIGNIIQLTPINGISALTRLFSAAFFSTFLRGRKTQKLISNLLEIDAKQAIGIDPRMEELYENIKHMEF